MFVITAGDTEKVLRKLNRDLDPVETEKYTWLLNRYGRMQIETDELVDRLFDAGTDMELIDLLLAYRETPAAHVPRHRRRIIYMKPFTQLTDLEINANLANEWF